MENKWKNKNFLSALKNSFNGIKYVFTTQRNLKIQVLISIIVFFASLFFKISFIEWAIITLIIFMVFFAELINTVVETIVDMITTEYNEKAKIAKDIAARSCYYNIYCFSNYWSINFFTKNIRNYKVG